MDKKLVEQRFAKHMSDYRRNAIVQREAGEKLLENLVDFAGRSEFPRIFEIGCGVGLLSEKIVATLKYNSIVLNDLVPECKDLTWRIDNSSFISGDVEKIAIPQNLDLIISNAVLQWISAVELLMSNGFDALNDGGIFCFSSFSPRNLPEIVSITGSGLKYLEVAELERMGLALFDCVEVFEKKNVLYFDSPMDVLRHLRGTGVNAVEQIRWGKRELENFCEQYQNKFSVNGRVSLTYAPLYFYARKGTKR